MSILLPALLSGAGFMQEHMVWSMGGRKPQGEVYDRLHTLLADICRRGNLGDPDFFKIYVLNQQTINACALGNRHIVVNEGALMYLDDAALEGILAHEMGHLRHGHTMVRLCLVGMEWFGNVICFVYSFLAILCRLIAWIPFVGWLAALWISLITWTHALFSRLLQIPMRLINAFGFRKHEYEADAYAGEIGLGQNLIRAFHQIQSFYGDQKSGFFTSLWEDHPDMDKRIERLEGAEVSNQ